MESGSILNIIKAGPMLKKLEENRDKVVLDEPYLAIRDSMLNFDRLNGIETNIEGAKVSFQELKTVALACLADHICAEQSAN